MEGLSGLYRGLNSTLITLFAANFIYFYAFHLLRLLLNRSKLFQMLKKNLKISQAVINLSIGTIAGGINVCFVQPLWVANARLKLQDSSKPSADHYNGMIDAIIKIRREEGLFKLWAGVSSSLLLCCNPAIQVTNFLQQSQTVAAWPDLPCQFAVLEAFILGAFAKWVATITTYPLQVAQTRLRFGKTSTSSQTGQVVEYNGTLDCLFLTFSSRGMETKLWHSTLISALMFLTYEKIQRLVGNAIIAKVAKKSKVN
uniref:Peroxisomal membrane protein PMP34 n=1 Tax=Guillardia theta (strain CCMP2712) TaxID=905079 RepID=A0A0C3TPZ9_GUITC